MYRIPSNQEEIEQITSFVNLVLCTSWMFTFSMILESFQVYKKLGNSFHSVMQKEQVAKVLGQKTDIKEL